jgi:hypothetical protein
MVKLKIIFFDNVVSSIKELSEEPVVRNLAGVDVPLGPHVRIWQRLVWLLPIWTVKPGVVLYLQVPLNEVVHHDVVQSAPGRSQVILGE